MISDENLRRFLTESNAIECLNGYSVAEFDEAKRILGYADFTVDRLKQFVCCSEPGALARTHHRISNVKIGFQQGTPSGSRVITDLDWLIECANLNRDPYILHRRYEDVHPFTDCNGRSGRLLWLWQMIQISDYDGSAGFLKPYYFQSLAHIDGSVI